MSRAKQTMKGPAGALVQIIGLTGDTCSRSWTQRVSERMPEIGTSLP